MLAVVLLLAVGLLAWRGQGLESPADPSPLPDERVVEVSYRVDASEWGKTRPTLCRIVHHYALGDDAAAATLYLNGRGGGCAAGSRATVAGETLRIAIWAAPEFEHCRAQALLCS